MRYFMRMVAPSMTSASRERKRPKWPMCQAQLERPPTMPAAAMEPPIMRQPALVFLTSRPVLSPDDPCPAGLRIYVRRNGAMPKHIILLNVAQVSQPTVSEEDRFDMINLGANTVALNVRYGYMQRPDVPSFLRALKEKKLIKINEKRWTILVGEEEMLIDPSLRFFRRLMLRFFIFIMRFTNSADRYFGLREFAGRNKTVIPVLIGDHFARVTVLDSEPVYDHPGAAVLPPPSS